MEFEPPLLHQIIGGCYVIAKRNKGKPKLTINGLSNRYKKMCQIYKLFALDWSNVVSFENDDMIEMFNHESYGYPIGPKNGFALGKKWMDVMIKMWKEDLADGMLFKFELYNDGRFPHDWLDKVLK